MPGSRILYQSAGFSHGWLGLLLIAVFWPLNWLLPDSSLSTAYLFFPLWFGYVLLVDAWVALRTGSSLLRRAHGAFGWLFAVSAPAWWLFEAINKRTQNWEYLGSDSFSGFEYFVLSTVSFSTVMPAVFETAELIRSFGAMDRFKSMARIELDRPRAWRLLAGGAVMLALTLAWPRYFYPFVWASVFLILEPINWLLGRRTLFDSLVHGDWRPVIALALGALVCGFFWEMWNYFSYPKWIYHTPGVEFLHIFEMPLLGYLGYIPFAWELFALRHFLSPESEPLRL